MTSEDIKHQLIIIETEFFFTRGGCASCLRACLGARFLPFGGSWPRGYRVPLQWRNPGFQARSRDLRGGRWSWTLKLAQKRSWVGRWSWAAQVGHLLLRVVQVVRQQQYNGHCLSDYPAQQLKEQLRSAQVAGQWRGDTALTLPLFWRRSTVSPIFFGRFPRSSLHSVVPFRLCPRP